MNPSAMADFFERLGHRVVRTKSSYWYDVRRRFYLGFPHHRLIDPSPDELYPFFLRLNGGVRYSGPPESPGRQSYALVCRDRRYDLDLLSSNTRSKVRRGLKHCTVEQLEPSYIMAHGKSVHDDTLRRIRIHDPYPWETYWRAVKESNCVAVWGALIGKTLTAYLVAVLVEGCWEILVVRSLSEFLRCYPNNALLFTVLRQMLSNPQIGQVFFGAESLEGLSSIDEFKLSMGFVKSPIRQRIVLHPFLRPALCNPLAVRAVGGLAHRQPQSEFWRKLDGLTAFVASGGA
ncbi:hypothetical protein MELA_01227 [Candidatus Methylomirabilis lanthanidiphila]|uniref:Phosphatidylglycerol lysyltransferase C-terminal domain-containing protein n=1 Tax=Candidatus Methylomirabilis lanthanidiphila TaxID=2211376 RepID=A0A564ZJP0_9BACT|nr:hypothetical protein [Candidatus Methylomirabilis lanthanidiphila]VUZ84852.1 hypothetical protein MELA_01227 [Candidatus Methylomirabilis lanthanidiphila]